MEDVVAADKAEVREEGNVDRNLLSLSFVLVLILGDGMMEVVGAKAKVVESDDHAATKTATRAIIVMIAVSMVDTAQASQVKDWEKVWK